MIKILLFQPSTLLSYMACSSLSNCERSQQTCLSDSSVTAVSGYMVNMRRSGIGSVDGNGVDSGKLWKRFRMNKGKLQIHTVWFRVCNCGYLECVDEHPD